MAVRLRIEMRHILPQWILTCCTMRRRSLRLLSPGTFLQLGRRYRNVFSGEKLPKGIFCPKTAGLNVEGIVPPSYLLKGT